MPSERTTRRAQRRDSPRSRHALHAALIGYVFQELDLGISLWEPGEPHSWHVIYELPLARNLLGHELEHGGESERVAYNNRCIREALRSGTVVGRHSGFRDLFVPLRHGKRANAVLVTGPFATERPNSSEVLDRWRSLTGRRGDPSDDDFNAYMSTTLSMIVLEGSAAADLQKLVERIAMLLQGVGDADQLYSQILSISVSLASVRFIDRMWSVAGSILDSRTSRIWESPNMARRLREVGVNRPPGQVAVGFLVNRVAGGDAVDEMLRCDAFQRACVELAREIGDVVCGKVGTHGVVLLSAHASVSRARRILAHLADRASSLARRRFGLAMHVGVADAATPLGEQYQAALAAAESAALGGVPYRESKEARPTSRALLAWGHELRADLDENPSALPARFDRYLEMVAERSRYRLDVARAYAEIGFAHVVEAVSESGGLDEHPLARLGADLERASQEAGSVSDLFASYRRAVSDVAASLVEPRGRSSDRSLSRAEQYMRKHYAQVLSLRKIARVSGFSPTYFSELFHKRRGTTFEARLMQLRIERAKQLLSGTTLNLERVARLSGLSSPSYLGRVFKRASGQTPMGYRNEVLERLRIGNATRLDKPKKVRRSSE